MRSHQIMSRGTEAVEAFGDWPRSAEACAGTQLRRIRSHGQLVAMRGSSGSIGECGWHGRATRRQGRAAILLADAVCHFAAVGPRLFDRVPRRDAANRSLDWRKRTLAREGFSAQRRNPPWLA